VPKTASDTQAPSKPGGFTPALASDGSAVSLSWSASTDNVGVASYSLERSLDQKTWAALGQAITDTSYTDSDTAFSKHYFYRLKALDAAGNASEYATGDITTGAFTANASAAQDLILSSEDGVMSAKLPPGTVDKQTDCSLVEDSDNKDRILSAGLLSGSGPYSLVCKLADGTQLDKFTGTVTIITSDKSKVYSKLTKLKFYRYDTENNIWVALDTSLNKKTHLLSATITQPSQIAVLGVAKKGISSTLIAIIVLPLILLAAFAVWRLRQQQKEQYSEYIRRKYYDL